MKDTKKYLENVLSLEMTCFEMNGYLNNLRQMLYQAEHPSFYAMDVENKPVGEERIKGIGRGILYGLIAAVVVGIVGWIMLLVLEVILDIFSIFSESNFIHWFASSGGNGMMKIEIALIIIAFLAPLIIMIMAGQSEAKENFKSNGAAKKLNEQHQMENQVIQEQAHRKAELLREEIDRAERLLHKTEDTLQTYYGTGIIYKKYWGLVPVAMFNEYFDSGRCMTLPEAYDRYEQEIRLDLILTKLDDIIVRLDRIEGNQYMLAEEIRSANRSIQNLTSIANVQLQKQREITDNQEIGNYYAQIAARNTSYLAWVQFNE